MSTTKSTITTYEYNSGTRELNIPFDYLRRDFVVVSLSGKTQMVLKLGTDYRFTSKTAITIIREYQPDAGFNKVIIRRVTDATKRIINFQDGSILNASELNISQLQSLHVAEEARDLSSYTLFVDDEGNLDARGRKIINLGTPDENSSDAVNIEFLEGTRDTILGARDETLQFRNDAERFRNEAEQFKNQASTSKSQAESAKNEAISSAFNAVEAATNAQKAKEQALTQASKATQMASQAQNSASESKRAQVAAKGSEVNAARDAMRAEKAAETAIGGGLPTVGGTMTGDIVMANGSNFEMQKNGYVFKTFLQGDNIIVPKYRFSTPEGTSSFIQYPTKSGSIALVEDIKNLTDFVSVKDFGAKGDGITDDTLAIKEAIRNKEGKPVYMPIGTYCISDTITVGTRWVTLQGAIPSRFRNQKNTTIKWIGGEAPKKAMIILGANEVGATPKVDCSGVTLKDLYLDGQNQVGILVYGTYLTNETIIEGISGSGSTEYNFYFAKAWYATIRDIQSGSCRNNGIAFGMPLEFSDGTKYEWGVPNLELNNIMITNIRSHSSGQMFMDGSYNPLDITKRRKGYGIGAGEGNGFRLEYFTSERSGGAGLYVYTSLQPSKSISKGYLEDNMRYYSGDKGNIILESAYASGGVVRISEVFNNLSSGHLYRFLKEGLAKSTIEYDLCNIEQGKRLKDYGPNTTDLRGNADLYGRYIMFTNCYYEFISTGFNNPLNRDSVLSASSVTKVNVRYDINLKNTIGECNAVLIKRLDNNYSTGGTFDLLDESGETITSRSMPNASQLPLNTWSVLVIARGIGALRAGIPQGGSLDAHVLFRFVKVKGIN